jgi:tripartite-type tricarboxylate transporter receptor subunit TctC
MSMTKLMLQLSLLALAAGVATAQTAAPVKGFPDKPIHFVVGASTPETVARVIAPKMSEALGTTVVVESLPGAGGNVAAERVARASADGYTILMSGDAAMTTNVTLFPNLGYDPRKDFAPISLIVDSVNILAVHPSVPAKSVDELVALAKSQPGALSFGSGGIGTSQHLGGELLKTMAHIDMLHVPYKTGAAVVPDLLGGRLTMQFGNISSMLPLVREGKLRALAVTSLERAPIAPDLVTIAESGFPGFEATSWVGMLAPIGTPAPIVRRLHEELVRVIAQPDVRNKLVELGFIVVANKPEAFDARIRAEIPRKGKLVQVSGAKVD